MARVGGRNAVAAWLVGLVCAGVVGVLAVLAAPLFPASLAWVGDTVGQSVTGRTDTTEETGERAAVVGPVADASDAECRDLYTDEAWASLRWTPEALLTPSTDAPTTSATTLAEALAPRVRLTCTWASDEGTIATTLADVPTDAGSIAMASLPAAGFECSDADGRVRCTRTDGDLLETIEAGGGVWLSTSQSGWRPDAYAQDVAERVWG